jgi:hypothetical protein
MTSLLRKGNNPRLCGHGCYELPLITRVSDSAASSSIGHSELSALQRETMDQVQSKESCGNFGINADWRQSGPIPNPTRRLNRMRPRDSRAGLSLHAYCKKPIEKSCSMQHSYRNYSAPSSRFSRDLAVRHSYARSRRRAGRQFV